MNDLRRIHVAAAIINGLALACALFGQTAAGVNFCALSALLLIWSAEKLRFHLVTREPRR